MITPRKGLAAAVVVLLLCALLNQQWTGWFTSRVVWAVHTLQWPAGWLASNTRAAPPVEYADFTDRQLADLKDQADAYNAALWEENRKLKEQLEAFRVIYGFVDIESIQPVEARVSRFTDDPVNPAMTLLRGTLHHIKPDDAVVYKANLIGFVESASPATCTVNLVTRPGYRTEIAIVPPGQVRMENNWPVIARAESDGEGAFTTELDKAISKALRPGDIVRVNDTLRPTANGFVLGTIDTIEDHPTRPLQLDTLTIRPRTPIGRQPVVTVLTDRPREAQARPQ